MAQIYTVLSGQAYDVEANSPEEAIEKFYWAEGHVSDQEVIDAGFDPSTWNSDEVSESETLTEVI